MTRPAVYQFAGHYINMGWGVVPLKGKDAFTPDWPNLKFRIEDFSNGHGYNIGLRSINGLVVLDDDFETPSSECDSEFLLDTGAIWGRPKKPRSKRLYLCPELTETVTFTDIDKSHLYQLRVGLQDMAPPSIHPETGERLRWNGLLLPPREVSRDALIGAARYRWTVGLIAKYWPARGRHDLRLAYARVLLETLDLPDDHARRILEWACRLGGSDEKGIHDVAGAISSTRSALIANQLAIGGPRVAQLLPNVGRLIVELLRDKYDKRSPVEEAIERLNETYFLIDVGTDTVVGEQIAKSDTTRHWTELRFRSFEAFSKKLVKQTLQVGAKTTRSGVEVPMFKPLADVWLKSPRGRQYDRLVYAPEGSGIPVGPNDLNGWKGFTVRPAPGDWSLTRNELLFKVMCRSNTLLFEWTLDWFAALFQRPGQHGETGLALTGPQGCGKNVIAEQVIGWSFDGRHARVTTRTTQVIGEFNTLLSGLCLLVLDEVGLSTMKEYNAIKGLVTAHHHDVNWKGINIIPERSMLHVNILSNDDVPIGKMAGDDRRFAIYHLLDTYANDTKFFAAIARELDEMGGRAAMLHELLHRTVNWDRLRFAPDTEWKQTAKRQNWTPPQWFFFRMMREVGEKAWVNHVDKSGHPLRRLKKTNEEQSYLVYLSETKSRDVVKDARMDLHAALKKLVPKDWDFNRVVDEAREYWTLPDWKAFQESFALAVGCPIEDLLAEESPEQQELTS